MKAYKEIHKAQLPYINIGIATKPFLIVFSAIPGSGKTELTKRLVTKHGFSSIANKDIRKAMQHTKHTSDVVIGEYTTWLLDKLAKQGPFSIVFDRNIVQWHTEATNWANQNDYNLVVVRIEVVRSKLIKRLHSREGSKVRKVLNVLEYYHNEHERIIHNLPADIVLEGDYDLDASARLIADKVINC